MTNAADQLPTEIAPSARLLTTAEFHRLADVPPEIEWFANLSNAGTRRVYENAVIRGTISAVGMCGRSRPIRRIKGFVSMPPRIAP